MVDFDAVAPQFDPHRALPAGVASRVRDALWQTAGGTAGRSVLEIGAGTGRIGRAFPAAGDAYVGLDRSWGMLDQFVTQRALRRPGALQLVQADGLALPFAAGTFDAVLLVQVLSGLRGWRQVLGEARRVLRPGGRLALGQSVPPADGVDRQMRAHLVTILADLGAEGTPSGARPGAARTWLVPHAHQHTHVIAATWEQARSPGAFLARHATGAHFAALPRPVQDAALARLAAWAHLTFGALDAPFVERWAFELEVFRFDEETHDGSG